MADQLVDVIAGTVHPRPRIERHVVELKGGGVVVVIEVYPSLLELHMVTGYGEQRYYKRGPKGNLPMTEHEVRERYMAIAARRTSLVERMKALPAAELADHAKIDETILLVPWDDNPLLLDPRVLGTLGAGLRDALSGLDVADLVEDLKLGADGYRAKFYHALAAPPKPVVLSIAVLKNGVIHQSFHEAFRETEDKQAYSYSSVRAVARLATTLALGRHVYTKASYWGPVRLTYFLRRISPFSLTARASSREIRVQPCQSRPLPSIGYRGSSERTLAQWSRKSWTRYSTRTAASHAPTSTLRVACSPGTEKNGSRDSLSFSSDLSACVAGQDVHPGDARGRMRLWAPNRLLYWPYSSRSARWRA